MCHAARGGPPIELPRHGAQNRKITVDKTGINFALPKGSGSAQIGEEEHVGSHPGDHCCIERLGKPIKRAFACWRVGDELGDHWIVKWRHLAAGFDAAVHPDIIRKFQRHDCSSGWQKAVFGIFGVDARLDRVSLKADLVLAQRQLFACGDPELPLDQIEAGNRLGHWMLDLQPRVHFDEPESACAQPGGAVGDELHCAGAAVVHRLCRGDRRFADCRAQFRRHARRQRLLNYLLVAPLQRTIALAKMNRVAVVVAEDLDFDVPGRGDKFLDQDPAGCECRLALAHGAFKRGIEISVLVDPPHATAAAAGSGLDQHRIADLVGLFPQEFRILAFTVITGNNRHTGALHELFGMVLQSHCADCACWRTDKYETCFRAGLGEVSVLGQKAVARMHAFRAGSLGCRHQMVDCEIACARLGASDQVGLIA